MKRYFLFIFLIFSLCSSLSSPLFAHGSMEVPLSRLYNCYKEGPESPKSAACKAAVQVGGSAPLYDWMSMNQATANDNHQAVIPPGSGKLCSGGRDTYKGFAIGRNDWVATTIAPDSNKQFQFVFYATAPHASKYMKLYISKDSYNTSAPLDWADLVEAPFCTVTSLNLVNSRYQLNCPFPPGNAGRHVIFTVWQRSDSLEAFYACNDVILSGSTVPPTPTTWKSVAVLTANSTLVLNTKVQFRLFNNGSEAANFTVQMGANQLGPTQWPYYLAQAVNASGLVNIGVLNSAGNVVPAMSSTLNNIYVKAANVSSYTYGIDFIQPNDDYNYIYPNGIANYVVGTKVLGSDSRRYSCKIPGWCRGSSFYYAPGTGLAWDQAWTLIS